MLFTSLSWSVLGKTLPDVLSTARGRRRRTSRLANNIFLRFQHCLQNCCLCLLFFRQNHFQNNVIKEIKNERSALLSSISTWEFLRTRGKRREAPLAPSSVLKNSQVLIELNNARGTSFFISFNKIYRELRALRPMT